jgi:hypothetical protein
MAVGGPDRSPSMGDPKHMQWIVDHWFELATTALLAVIASNTFDSNWNNSTMVEQLNDIIRGFSSLARRDAASRRNLGR